MKKEVYRLWKCTEVNIIPVVVGTLETVSKGASEVTGKTTIDLLGSAAESLPIRNGENIEEGLRYLSGKQTKDTSGGG